MTERYAVPSGPFQIEPFDLGRLLSAGSSGDEVVCRSERWLVEVLGEAEVELGAADREIAALIAADGWSVAQVVGGWVRRAVHRPVVRELVAPGVTRVG